ncbi:unnamed protein product [Rotaria sp. Silwood2]|nr:unnamed protein product [Rotaria sp. Silwood2]CAF3244489.1 unnamed protein product [Rotaria sp. Silwood2]CAF3319155.1 unnamed protein product [Rotaria sp. Silwood2]CAF4317951.1 unnamed protein product [Rotaria sp. Silwood2]CAF4326128.1 unnamed protein product [Rotaria sp. Silwood2]
MWMFSGTIVELPPKLRNRRCNMVLISIWVGYVEPSPTLWLKKAVNKLETIKTQGQHINKKRQYYYESINLRTAEQYLKASKIAERTKTNVYGHYGNSALENILDVPLPKGIVLDYLHVSLLGHAKAIILSIYHQLKPAQREQFNVQLKSQKFPHFFQRKIRTIDNFAFVKGTEVRNLLFYGLLPHLKLFLSIEQFSHLSLYICAIRLLHSGHVFGEKTREIADPLFSIFYKDHELFYLGLQNFKLHLHAHYASIYESHGSLSNLGCFGQEDFIGSVSANYHGTRYYGNSITYYYNIDFFIQNKKQERTVTNGPYDLSSTLANDYEHVKQFHTSLCNCIELTLCCIIYRRFIIHNEMFHSLIYYKRQDSVSYFVQYSFNNDVQDTRFGAIELFFIFNELGYAVIKHHRIKELCSDIFKACYYYHLLKMPIDSLYFSLEKNDCGIDIVRTDNIFNHCIVVEKNDCLFVTTISSYNEHD